MNKRQLGQHHLFNGLMLEKEGLCCGNTACHDVEYSGDDIFDHTVGFFIAGRFSAGLCEDDNGLFCGADLIAASYAASQSRSYVGTMAAYNAGDSYGRESGCG